MRGIVTNNKINTNFNMDDYLKRNDNIVTNGKIILISTTLWRNSSNPLL